MAAVPVAARELDFGSGGPAEAPVFAPSGNGGPGDAPALETISPAYQGLSGDITTFQDMHTESAVPIESDLPDGRHTVAYSMSATLKEGLERVAEAFDFGSCPSLVRSTAFPLKKMLMSLCHRGKGSFFEHVGVNKIIQFAKGLVARKRAPAGNSRTRRGQILDRMVRDISKAAGRAHSQLQALPPEERLLDKNIEVKLQDGTTEVYLELPDRQQDEAHQSSPAKRKFRFRSPDKISVHRMRSSHGNGLLNAVGLASASLLGVPADPQSVNMSWRALVGKRRIWGGFNSLLRGSSSHDANPDDSHEPPDEKLSSDMFNATPSHARAGGNRGGYISRSAKNRRLTRKHCQVWCDQNFPKNSPTAFAAASLEGGVRQRSTDTLRYTLPSIPPPSPRAVFSPRPLPRFPKLTSSPFSVPRGLTSRGFFPSHDAQAKENKALYAMSDRVLSIQPTPKGWCFSLRGVLFLAIAGLLRRNPKFFHDMYMLPHSERRPAKDVISDVFLDAGQGDRDAGQGDVEVGAPCLFPLAPFLLFPVCSTPSRPPTGMALRLSLTPSPSRRSSTASRSRSRSRRTAASSPRPTLAMSS